MNSIADPKFSEIDLRNLHKIWKKEEWEIEGRDKINFT